MFSVPFLSSLSFSMMSWLVAIDGSEQDFTSCGKLPKDNEVDGPGLISRSDSGLDAYDNREVVFIGNRNSSDNVSEGCTKNNFVNKVKSIINLMNLPYFPTSK